MNIQMLGKNLLMALVAFCLFAHMASSKCQNTTDFRYDLSYPAQIVNYNLLCFEQSKRTCCSPANLEALSKKISKLLGSSTELSLPCRRRITALMCSSCDGDVGENVFQGVCSGFCHRLFEQCRNDLFSIDSNNQLKVCREEDIICSPLDKIVAERGQGFTCGLFDQRLSTRNCWNGEISARLRGKGLKKIKATLNKAPSKKSGTLDKANFYQMAQVIAFIIFATLAAFVIYRFLMKKYHLWKKTKQDQAKAQARARAQAQADAQAQTHNKAQTKAKAKLKARSQSSKQHL